MQRGMRRRTGGYRVNQIKLSETLLQPLAKIAIVFLCVYISFKCINIISDGESTRIMMDTSSDTSNVIAREIVENTGVMTQYMISLII